LSADGPAFLVDGPADADCTLVLAHGAGAPMDSPFMERIAGGVGAAGFRVVRFEFPYMHRRRRDGKRRPPDRTPVLEQAWRVVVEEIGGGMSTVIGGKSLGGRIASRVADELGVEGLVCLGYPFHPPGRPERLRTAHLVSLRTPALIVQGTRDPFGGPEEVDGYGLSDGIRVRWIEDGDHSLKPRRASGRTEEGNLAEAVEAVVGFLQVLG
jgi:predicted alpha/beta-hydrolase family hydrolase